MPNYTLVDFDSILYAACLCSKDEQEDGFEIDKDTVIQKINSSINGLFNTLKNTYDYNTDAYKLFITDKNNWRKIIYKDYKSNRKDRPKPHLLGFARDYAENELNAFRADLCEADELLLCTKKHLEKDFDNNVVIASLDKDLYQTAGKFFNLFHTRYNLVTVDEQQALQNRWKQCLIGDSTDGFKFLHGLGAKGAEKLLKDVTTNMGALRVVYAEYIKRLGRVHGREKFLLTYRLAVMPTENIPYATEFETLF